MTIKSKATGRAASLPASLAIGVGFALLWTVLGAMLVAKLVDNEVMPQESIGYGSMAILLTASFLAAAVSFGKLRRQRVPVCLGAGGAYFLCLLAVTALFFGGQYEGMGVTAVLVLLGAGAAILPGCRGRGGNSRKRYKIPRG